MDDQQRTELNRRMEHLARAHESGESTTEQYGKLCRYTLVEFGCTPLDLRCPQRKPNENDGSLEGLSV